MIYDELHMKYNSWQDIKYTNNNGEDMYNCKCKCGKVENHTKDQLLYDRTRMCIECTKHDNVERQRKKYEGMTFGSWRVENFIGNRRYECVCTSCNKRYNMVAAEFERSNRKDDLKCKACSGYTLKDLKGKTFGDYYVIEYVGNHYWKCRCNRCGIIKNITSQHLTLNNNTKCIKCSNKEAGLETLQETINKNIGKKFGLLTVTGYNFETNRYICECSCKNKTVIEVLRGNLFSGSTKSCGCLRNNLRKQTMLERYGDTVSKRMLNPRDINDINDIEDKDRFVERYNKLKTKLGRTPNSFDVSKEFDITTPIALKYAHMYGVDIDTETGAHSHYEDEILEIFNCDVRTHVRDIIYPQELDIYIPEKHLAIEFNGSYWHSTEYVDKYYHQKKTIECAKKGIRLIHVFEHEWVNNDTRKKIENIIKNACDININIDADELNIIDTVNLEECEEFLNKYHLQGDVNSEIRIGLCNNVGLLAVMTFTKSKLDYRITRFCTKAGYNINKAANKLIKYFINKYNPTSIFTYCDITKFYGNTFIEEDFTCSLKDITEPNYVWVNSSFKIIDKINETLTEQLGQTEDEIMHNLGYYKVYDSGNLKLVWFRK